MSEEGQKPSKPSPVDSSPLPPAANKAEDHEQEGCCDDADMFERLHSMEEEWYQRGYEDGLKDGEEQGRLAGLETGRVKGYELGSELAYYYGGCQAWKGLVHMSTGHTGTGGEGQAASLQRARLLKTVEGIEEMIDAFPSTNAEVDLLEAMQKIRARFKAATSLMGVSLSFQPKAKTAATDLSF